MFSMKMGRFHNLCVISLLILLTPWSVSSDTDDLIFTINDVENIHNLVDTSTDGAKGYRFYFRLSLQIENPTNEIISIQHKNSCGYMIYMSYTGDQHWESREKGCYAIVWTQNLDPGLTELNVHGSIFFKGANELPHGIYSFTIIVSDIQFAHDYNLGNYSSTSQVISGFNNSNNLEEIDPGPVTTTLTSSYSFIYLIGTLIIIKYMIRKMS